MERFARSRGYSRSSLEKWARAHRDVKGSGSTPKFARIEVLRGPSVLVVEVGTARIRVSAGFDDSLLRQVVAALKGEA